MDNIQYKKIFYLTSLIGSLNLSCSMASFYLDEELLKKENKVSLKPSNEEKKTSEEDIILRVNAICSKEENILKEIAKQNKSYKFAHFKRSYVDKIVNEISSSSNINLDNYYNKIYEFVSKRIEVFIESKQQVNSVLNSSEEDIILRVNAICSKEENILKEIAKQNKSYKFAHFKRSYVDKIVNEISSSSNINLDNHYNKIYEFVSKRIEVFIESKQQVNSVASTLNVNSVSPNKEKKVNKSSETVSAEEELVNRAQKRVEEEIKNYSGEEKDLEKIKEFIRENWVACNPVIIDGKIKLLTGLEKFMLDYRLSDQKDLPNQNERRKKIYQELLTLRKHSKIKVIDIS